MRILYVGPLWYGGTCLQRMEAMKHLGHEVIPLDTEPENVRKKESRFLYRMTRKIFGPLDLAGVNQQIISLINSKEKSFDIVWLDKGVIIKPEALIKIKEISPHTLLVHYNPDDPFGTLKSGWQTFLEIAPFFDVHFVPRKENLPEYRKIGCKNVYRFYRGYDPALHRPIPLSEMERKKYDSDVCFIGAWEREREAYLAHLVVNAISVSIWGRYWERGKYWNLLKTSWRGTGLRGEEYVKALCAAKICLCFLRKQNRDQQNSRTFEIPACGAFMLAERTREHLELFEEGKETEFFSTKEELLEKVRYYLNHEEERKEIGKAGRERCLKSGYSNHDRLRWMFSQINSMRMGKWKVAVNAREE